jgi:CubicO group peptidase (beta-lactamase class C family)
MAQGEFDRDRLRAAEEILERHVAERTTPGAVGLAVRREGVVARWAVGRHTYEQDSTQVRADDLYDLASLTKVVVTTTLCMILEAAGNLDLDDAVAKWLPEFDGGSRQRVTVRHLLAHCSGLPAHIPFFESCGSMEEVQSEVLATALTYEPGKDTVYSDLGFLLLGMIVAACGGEALEKLAQRHVFDPVGMGETGYLPNSELLPRIPPTEVNAEHRGGLIHGEVHDGNAAAMGGIAPHAGLFGKADDLGRFLQVMLCGGRRDEAQVFPAEGIGRFTKRAGLADGSSRALGWDTVSVRGSSAGRHFSTSGYGHTGFTGTTLWADPQQDLGVVLLTNRVHPSRDREGIKRLRPEFHGAVAEAVLGL